MHLIPKVVSHLSLSSQVMSAMQILIINDVIHVVYIVA